MNPNYEYWLSYEGLDADTRRELESIAEDADEIEARFAVPMRFGTAGLRSVMAAGISRMNVYTVAQTTQALANLVCRHGGQARGHRLRQPQQLDALCRDGGRGAGGQRREGIYI